MEKETKVEGYQVFYLEEETVPKIEIEETPTFESAFEIKKEVINQENEILVHLKTKFIPKELKNVYLEELGKKGENHIVTAKQLEDFLEKHKKK